MPAKPRFPPEIVDAKPESAEETLARIKSVVESADDHRTRSKRDAWQEIKSILGIGPSGDDEA